MACGCGSVRVMMRASGGVCCVRGSVGGRCMRRCLCGCGGVRAIGGVRVMMRAIGGVRTIGGVWCVRGHGSLLQRMP